MSKHPFFLVMPSPLPFLASVASLFTVLGLIFSWSNAGSSFLFFSLLFLSLITYFWCSSIITEGTYLGYHTTRVQSCLRLGFCLFIVSEIFFFLAFFWAYFHSSLSPAVEIGSLWPPLGITPLSPFGLPLLNTVLLLTSGATVTWSHHSLCNCNTSSFLLSLGLTIFLGVFFVLLQGYEYYCCSFCISDSVFGSCFYLATGFHGLHVFFGTLFLFVDLIRGLTFHFSSTRHLGFLFACWYWHFVDVVWVLLFLIVYCWGS